MRKILFILLLPFFANAGTTYYVKVAGGSGAGTSDATAWSYAKFNSVTLVAGDSVLFKRGDLFYGALTVSTTGNSSNRIVYSCYGTGAKPLISGFTTLSGWSSIGGGVYQTACASCKLTDNMVTRDGVEQVIGRYPNSGYLTYQSASGSSSITSSSLSGTPNYTGGQVAIRTNEYTTDRCSITSQSGGTINYTSVSGYNATPGFGFFIQKDSLTLDSLGEWYMSASGNMKMYFGGNTPSSYVIKTTTVDTLVFVLSKNYITFDNIDFEGGNVFTIYSGATDHMTVQHCSINFSGANGIFYGGAVTNLNISYDTINHSNSDGIYSSPYLCANNYIGYNVIKNNGTVGMGLYDGYVGIQYVTNRSVIEYNEVDTSGYAGIYYYGDSLNVRNNTINYFCFLKQDGGGIYSYPGSDTATYIPSTVANNTIMNGIGATAGGIPVAIAEARGYYEVDGIYLDLNSSQAIVSGNNISNCAASGIYLNQNHSITVTGNTLTNNNNGLFVVGAPTYGITFSNNTIQKLRTSNSFTFYYFVSTPYTLPVTSNNNYIGGFDTDSSFKYSTGTGIKKTWVDWITSNATSDGNSVLTSCIRAYGRHNIKFN